MKNISLWDEGMEFNCITFDIMMADVPEFYNIEKRVQKRDKEAESNITNPWGEETFRWLIDHAKAWADTN